MNQFIKQNLFIVVMIGVTLVILLFAIVPMMDFGQARAQAKGMSDLSGRLANASAPGRYESPEWIHRSKGGIDEIKSIQEQVIETALKFGYRRPLMIDGKLIFPPTEDSFAFAKPYKDQLEEFAAKVLAGGTLPTSAEVDKRVKEAAEQFRLVNQPEPKDLERIERARLVSERARAIRIWVSKDSLEDYIGSAIYSTGVRAMTPEEIWRALLSWWVQKDIVEAIAAVNQLPRLRLDEAGQPVPVTPTCVLDSPIKELCWVKVTPEYYGLKSTAGATPKPSLTGQVTNDRYDVLHYEFQVVMDASMDLQLDNALSTQNFHTRLAAKYQSLDKRLGVRDTAADVADYGDDNVVLATFRYEAIFMKSPQSWRGKPEDAQRKRIAFLRAGDNARLVLQVNRVRPNSPPAVELSYADLTANPKRLAETLQLAQLKLEANGDVARMQQLLANDKDARFAAIRPLASDAARLRSVTEGELRFIVLYEDLMPEKVRATLPGLGPSGR